MMRALLTALALLIASRGAGRRRRTASLPWTDPRPQARSRWLLRSTMIAAHNAGAAAYGVAAAGVGRRPGTRRRRLCRNGSPEPTGSSMTATRPASRARARICSCGTRGAYSYDEMIGLLVDERRYFRPGRFPDVSTDRQLSGMSAIIPRSSGRRRSGSAAPPRPIAPTTYLVCRYLPAGNVVGTMLR